MIKQPDRSGFLGYYSLNDLDDPFLKRYELELDSLPKESYWFLTENNRFKVYTEDVKIGDEKKKKLQRIRGKDLRIAVQRGMRTNQYEYKWE